VKLEKIEAKASIFPTSRDAHWCAAKLDRRDTPPPLPFWNAVSIALHFVGTELHRVVSSRPSAAAYRVHLEAGNVVEAMLKPAHLGKGSPQSL
jgi:hypothetical protein